MTHPAMHTSTRVYRVKPEHMGRDPMLKMQNSISWHCAVVASLSLSVKHVATSAVFLSTSGKSLPPVHVFFMHCYFSALGLEAGIRLLVLGRSCMP